MGFSCVYTPSLNCISILWQILKKQLLANGLSRVQIVASDGSWDVSADILKHPDFAEVVDVIG